MIISKLKYLVFLLIIHLANGIRNTKNSSLNCFHLLTNETFWVEKKSIYSSYICNKYVEFQRNILLFGIYIVCYIFIFNKRFLNFDVFRLLLILCIKSMHHFNKSYSLLYATIFTGAISGDAGTLSVKYIFYFSLDFMNFQLCLLMMIFINS